MIAPHEKKALHTFLVTLERIRHIRTLYTHTHIQPSHRDNDGIFDIVHNDNNDGK